jgi:hypothetical protein
MSGLLSIDQSDLAHKLGGPSTGLTLLIDNPYKCRIFSVVDELADGGTFWQKL